MLTTRQQEFSVSIFQYSIKAYIQQAFATYDSSIASYVERRNFWSDQ